MKKRAKKWCSLLLSFSLILSLLVPGTVLAADVESDSVATADSGIVQDAEISSAGSDSVGTMLAEEARQQQQKQTAQVSISGLTFEGNRAKVEFSTDTDAELVVAVYDEQQVKMIASGKRMISASRKKVTVRVDTAEMPEYFVATAYLLDKETHNPLCSEYTTRLYTKNMKKLEDSTTDDYDEKRILRLEDGNQETNFAVYNEETLVVETSEEKNHVEKTGENTYRITNAEESVSSLKKGDTFSTKNEDGNVYLIKIAEISTDGSTVTIREDTNTDLTDYFDYVKVESEGFYGGYDVDNSNLSDGVTWGGYGARNTRATLRGDVGGFYNINIEDDGVTAKGGVTLLLSPKIVYFITDGEQYFNLTLDYSLNPTVTVTGTENIFQCRLGTFTVPMPGGFRLKVSPELLLEISAECTLEFGLKGRTGGIYSSVSGLAANNTTPSWSGKFEVQGKAFAGINFNPEVVFLDSRICSAGLDATVGVEASSTLMSSEGDRAKERIHQCKRCWDGDISVRLNVSMNVDILKKSAVRQRLLDISFHLTDFYWCLDHGEFDTGTCPYIYYMVKISVTDRNGDRATKCTLTGKNLETGNEMHSFLLADKNISDYDPVIENGEMEIYLRNGFYQLKVWKCGNSTIEDSCRVAIDDRSEEVEMRLIYKEETATPTPSPKPGGGGNISWRKVGQTLYISGSGPMPDYTTGGSNESTAPWSVTWIQYDVNKIIVEEGITSIGSRAFQYFGIAGSVQLPEGITSIGEAAFIGCRSMAQFRMPATVTEVGDYAFSGCVSLLNFQMPQGIRKIGKSAFAKCGTLTSLTFPDSLESIGEYAFSDCVNLQNLEIRNASFIGDGAFMGCTVLATLKLENIDYIGIDVFYKDNNLFSVELKNINIMEAAAFIKCTGLRKVVLDNINYLGRQSFEACTSLEEVQLQNVTYIGNSAFNSCTSLREIRIPEGTVSVGEWTFNSCENLQTVYLPETLRSIGSYVFSDCSNLEMISFPQTMEYIGASAFNNCTNLKTISLPQTMEYIGESAFSGCESLTHLKIPEGIAVIENYLFTRCTSLETIEFPESLESLGCLFYWTDNTAVKNIYFKGELKHVGVSSMYYGFLKGVSDATIYYPEGVEAWNQIINRSWDGTNITWVPYDPYYWDGIKENSSEAVQEVSAGETIAFDAAVAEFGDGSEAAEPTEESSDQEAFVVEEEIPTEEDAEFSDSVQDQEEAADISVENTLEDGISEENAEEEIITEIQIPDAVYAQETAGTKGSSMMYTGRKPGSFCLFIAVKDKGASDLLADGNLLYISQKLADSKGKVTFTYGLKEDWQNPIFCVFGEEQPKPTQPPVHKHTYGKWQVSKKATVFAAETQTRKCSGCGKKENRTYGKKLTPVLQTNATSVILKTGQSTSALKVTKMAAGDSVVSWKSANTKIVKVSGKGKLTAGKKTGTTTVTIKLKSGFSRKIKVKVQKGVVKTTKINGLTSKLTLRKGKKATLKPVLVPFTSTERITYISSNKKVVTVSSKGVLTAKKPGKAKVTVRSGRKKYVITVTVPKK